MRMRILLLASLVASLLTALAVTATAVGGPNGSDNGTMCVFNAQLRPENEIPGPSTSTAKGHVQIKVRNDGTIEYKFFVLNKAGEEFRAAHIHREVGTTQVGPPIIFLFGPTSTTEKQIRGKGEITGQEATAEDICENPSRYYVNFHTRTIPAGAIRGDLG